MHQAFYASLADFFRWKMLRLRDLLRGFFSLLMVCPRDRDLGSLGSSPAIYLSL